MYFIVDSKNLKTILDWVYSQMGHVTVKMWPICYSDGARIMDHQIIRFDNTREYDYMTFKICCGEHLIDTIDETIPDIVKTI